MSTKTHLPEVSTSAGSNQIAGEPGFKSYAVKAGRWTFQALKLDHDNIVDMKIWAAARRVVSAFVGTIAILAGSFADAVRGLFYLLPKNWVIHNSGTTPLAKISKAAEWLQPTKNFYQATARNIAKAFRSAGDAVQSGQPNNRQSWKILNDAFEAEANQLANHFIGLSTDEIRSGMAQFKNELNQATANRPDYYPHKNDTTKALGTAKFAIEKIEEKLPNALVSPLAKACIEVDGTFNRQKRTMLTNDLLKGKVLPSKALSRFRKLVDAKGKAFEQEIKARIAVEEAKKAVGADPMALKVADQKDPKVVVAGDPAALKVADKRDPKVVVAGDPAALKVADKKDPKKTVAGDPAALKVADKKDPKKTVAGDPAALKVAGKKDSKVVAGDPAALKVAGNGASNPKEAAKKTKKIGDTFDAANSILEKLVQQQELVLAKFKAIQSNLKDKEQLVAQYPKLRGTILDDLEQKGYALESIVDAVTMKNNDADKVIAAAVKPLKDLRDKIGDDARLRKLQNKVNSIGNKIESLNIDLAKIPLPNKDDFKAYATVDQKAKAAKYDQLVNRLYANNSITQKSYVSVNAKETEVALKIFGLLQKKPEFKRVAAPDDLTELLQPAQPQSALRWALKQIPLVNRVVA